MFALLSLSTAFAQVPAWKWTSEPVKFHAETHISQPRGARYEAFYNLDAWATAIDLSTEFSCQATGEKGMVRCSFEWLKLSGRAAKPAEQEELEKILNEWADRMVGYTVELSINSLGKVQAIDLDGTERADSRQGFIVERERLLLVRIFCMLDQPFPKSEEAYQEGWPAKGWLPIFALINTTGTSGSMQLTYTNLEPRNGYVFVETAGTGLISAGAGVDSGGDSLVNASVAGSTLFDPTAGNIAYRNFVMEAYYLSGNSSTPYYQQSAAIQRIAAFGTPGAKVPALPPGPLPDSAAPAAAPAAPAEPPAPAPAEPVVPAPVPG
jgi:hypothetical protein